MLSWLLCFLLVVVVVVLWRAWRDNKEKPHLWIAVLIIVIVLIVPCFLRLFGAAGIETGH